MMETVSEVYRDERGKLRHTNCRGRACQVPNCRDSRVAPTDPALEINLPDTHASQVVIYRDGVTPGPRPADSRGVPELTLRSYLIIQALMAGADLSTAAEVVSSTALEHPDWDLDETRTYPEWQADD